MPHFDWIAFDADDTLWHNERIYNAAQAKFHALLVQYHSIEWIDDRLYQTEMRNLEHFGYGIKAFALSMIETAVELTEGRIAGSDIQTIINIAHEMLSAEVELLEHVDETISVLAQNYPLMVITKGDLRDQEMKMVRSGLARHFRHVEIVSDKTQTGYSALMTRLGVAPDHFLMVGNSLRSDILPVLALGATAVYIPYQYTWAHEAAYPPQPGYPGFYQLEHIGLLPALLAEFE